MTLKIKVTTFYPTEALRKSRATFLGKVFWRTAALIVDPAGIHTGMYRSSNAARCGFGPVYVLLGILVAYLLLYKLNIWNMSTARNLTHLWEPMGCACVCVIERRHTFLSSLINSIYNYPDIYPIFPSFTWHNNAFCFLSFYHKVRGSKTLISCLLCIVNSTCNISFNSSAVK